VPGKVEPEEEVIEGGYYRFIVDVGLILEDVDSEFPVVGIQPDLIEQPLRAVTLKPADVRLCDLRKVFENDFDSFEKIWDCLIYHFYLRLDK
jgi:hypothetical protein